MPENGALCKFNKALEGLFQKKDSWMASETFRKLHNLIPEYDS